MILRLYNCEFIEIDLTKYAALLEIEPQKIFCRMLEDLSVFAEMPAELAVYRKDERVKQSDICVISDAWNFEINSRALLTKIYKYIEATVYTDIDERMKFDNLIAQVKKCVLHALEGVNVDFDLCDEVDVKDILSALKVQPLFTGGDNCHRLENFFDLCRELKLYRLIVLVQARAFLSEEERAALSRRALANGLGLIMLENSISCGQTEYEKKITVDKDYCDMLK